MLGSLFGMKKPEIDYGQLWRNYKQWGVDDDQTYQDEIGRTRARLAAGGAKPGSAAWEAGLRGVEEQMEERRTQAQDSETYRLLQAQFDNWRWLTSQQQHYEEDNRGGATQLSLPMRDFNRVMQRLGRPEVGIGESATPEQLEGITMADYYDTLFPDEQMESPEQAAEMRARQGAGKSAMPSRAAVMERERNPWM